MARNKYGFPVPAPKTMTAHSKKRKFASGGDLVAESEARVARKQAGIEDPKPNSYLDSVKDTLQNYKNAAIKAVTPKAVEQLQTRAQKMQDTIDANDNTNAPVQEKRKGGKVKHTPRGVGVALRGHGKAGR